MVDDAILSVTAATQEEDILSTCRHLLQTQSFTTQDAVRQQLVELGYLDVSQSTVSRLLSKLGVAKVPNAHGQKVYTLSGEMEPVYAISSIGSQIDEISCSQAMVVVKTHPGGAQLIARLIDLHPTPTLNFRHRWWQRHRFSRPAALKRSECLRASCPRSSCPHVNGFT